MPKYYSLNLVQIPTCHGSLACDYDKERRGGEGRGEQREGEVAETQLPCWLRLRGDGRPQWRSAQARSLPELPVDPVKYHRKKSSSDGGETQHLLHLLHLLYLLYAKQFQLIHQNGVWLNESGKALGLITKYIHIARCFRPLSQNSEYHNSESTLSQWSPVQRMNLDVGGLLIVSMHSNRTQILT